MGESLEQLSAQTRPFSVGRGRAKRDEDDPCDETLPLKIVILEEAQKLAVIHRTSTREYRFGQRTLHQTGSRSSIVFGWRKLGICFSGIGLNHSVQFQKVDGQECEIIAEILKSK